MATVTPNFNWPVPTSTDLVKDGATAIEALGDSIDASLVDLKGGTSGQVLSKNSNTDMDFVWVTSDDANAIQNTIVDAKGDLITATAADTPARLAVGANGETLVADSSTSTGLRYTAGNPIPNPVLNSCFDIWQRGTSIAGIASGSNYTADRWIAYAASANATISRQATGDTTNLPNVQYAARIQRTAASTATGQINFTNPFETTNSIPFAGKTVTLSIYARAGANFSATSNQLVVQLNPGTGTDQNPYSGYSGSLSAVVNSTATLTTTWQRFTFTGTVPTTATEMSVQTIFYPSGTAGANDYYEITGVQIDIGSVALPVRRNGATLQGELAACQRYYQRWVLDNSAPFVTGMAISTTEAISPLPLETPLRVAPTSLDYSNLQGADYVANKNFSAASISGEQTSTAVRIYYSGATSLTQYRPYIIRGNGSAAYIAVSAEL